MIGTKQLRMKRNLSSGRLIWAIFSLMLCIAGNAQNSIVLLNKWGSFGTHPGDFKYPTMLAVDSEDNLFVVDQHNHRIQKFDSDGNFILMWGKAGDGFGEFRYPYGIAVDSDDKVYISDMNNNRIQKFSNNGTFIKSIGSYGSDDDQLKYPYGIAVDKQDNLYVIDAFNYCIKKFNKELDFISKWGSPQEIGIKVYMPHEIAVTNDGNVILSDRQNHRISVFSAEGKLIERFGSYGEGSELPGGKFSEPHGLTVNKNGDIYVTDRYNFRVQQFESNNNFKTSWFVSAVFDSSLYFPLGIVTDSDRNVFVSDHYDHCIYKYKHIK